MGRSINTDRAIVLCLMNMHNTPFNAVIVFLVAVDMNNFKSQGENNQKSCYKCYLFSEYPNHVSICSGELKNETQKSLCYRVDLRHCESSFPCNFFSYAN